MRVVRKPPGPNVAVNTARVRPSDEYAMRDTRFRTRSATAERCERPRPHAATEKHIEQILWTHFPIKATREWTAISETR